jgi:hypothetical protein
MSKNYRTKTRISGQWLWRTIEMMASPAFRVLSHSAHRILDRLEIELAHHGGNDDGRLPVTFDHFAEYGIDRHSIAPAMREVEALKFIEATERGRAGNAEYRRPNRQPHETPGADRSNAHARGLRSSKQPVATRVARYTLDYLPVCRHHDGMILVSNWQVAVAIVERHYSGRYRRRGDAIRATSAVRTPF